jgi:hypothetical protein
MLQAADTEDTKLSFFNFFLCGLCAFVREFRAFLLPNNLPYVAFYRVEFAGGIGFGRLKAAGTNFSAA